MEVVGADVGCQRVLLSVKRESAFGDAVRDPAHRAAEIRVTGEVTLKRIESEGDIGAFPVAVGQVKFREQRPVIRDFCGYAYPLSSV